jgi:beta-lactamase class A
MQRRELTRRSVILSGLSLAACSTAPTQTRPYYPPDGDMPHMPETDPRVVEIEARIGGCIGVAAQSMDKGAIFLWHRAQERFAMCSTFKWLLAADILSHVEAGSLSLDAHVLYTEADLLEYAPVTRANIPRGWMTIEELCAAAVELSDNTAANLLLAQIGGPAGLTAFVRANGDTVTRLDRNEPDLNIVPPGDERDTSTALAMANTMKRVLLTDGALTTASRERLINWMVHGRTGANRLRAGAPADWHVGDKTGSGGPGAANDLAIFWPPRAAPIVVACFSNAPAADETARTAAFADIARIVVERSRT